MPTSKTNFYKIDKRQTQEKYCSSVEIVQEKIKIFLDEIKTILIT